MPEQPPKSTSSSSNRQTVVFMVILSFSCALILSLLASALSKPKEIAKDLDRSKQMMIAAKVLDPNGYFLLPDEKGNDVPAKSLADGSLVLGTTADIATQAQLLAVYRKRFNPMLVNAKGEMQTFESAKIIPDDYFVRYRKTGYYNQPLKLVYEILSNTPSATSTDKKGADSNVQGYVIPVNGFGLWDAIYGYLALKPDGDTIIGVTWYDQKETPGLGANIADPAWQSLFPGKLVFQVSGTGKMDYKTAPLGIIVVKGKVSDVFGDSPKAKSAVDGMAGATLTGNGVMDAYKDVLAAYRPFLLRIHAKHDAQVIDKN